MTDQAALDAAIAHFMLCEADPCQTCDDLSPRQVARALLAEHERAEGLAEWLEVRRLEVEAILGRAEAAEKKVADLVAALKALAGNVEHGSHEDGWGVEHRNDWRKDERILKEAKAAIVQAEGGA